MYFLAGLIVIYGILWILSRLGVNHFDSAHIQGTYAAAIMFILAGIWHFAEPQRFLKMIPKYVERRYAANFLVGIIEILLGIGLFIPDLRINAAYGLIGLLVLVFPANVTRASDKPTSRNIARLLLQPVFILWIYWFCIYHTW